MELKIISLSLMAVFYICYFTKMFAQRKRGICTDQLGKGKNGRAKLIEIALKITTYLLPILQLFTIMFYSGKIFLAVRIAGILIELTGIIIFIASIVEMKDNWRAGVQKSEKTVLVVTGIYTLSRNPAFLGFDLMYIGIMITFFRWYLSLGTILAIILLHSQIVYVEEPFLQEVFGEAYFEYRKKVFRYCGRSLRDS